MRSSCATFHFKAFIRKYIELPPLDFVRRPSNFTKPAYSRPQRGQGMPSPEAVRVGRCQLDVLTGLTGRSSRLLLSDMLKWGIERAVMTERLF